MARLFLFSVLLGLSACRFGDADGKWDLVTDADSDGFASDVDCDDGDETRYPGADETCNGLDDDCDDDVDEDPVDPSTFYVDSDGDGYGDDTEPTVEACDAPNGYASESGDCDDDDDDRNPGETDIPDDDIDQDCNGDDTISCFEDDDQDGWGTTTVVLAADGTCDTSQKEADNDDDCDDTDSDRFPGNIEIVGDGKDQNCDGFDTPPCYVDTDGDGFGDPLATTPEPDPACDGDFVSPVAGDCVTDDGTVHPGADELCDGLQNDCDNWSGPSTPGPLPADEVDDDDDGYVECTIDGDGWDGDPDVDGGDDCEDDVADSGAFISPEPTDPTRCDGLQNDCDDWAGASDPGTLPDYEVDGDDDGYVECTFDVATNGDGTPVTWGNLETPPVIGDEDCEPEDPDVYPGAPELCDGFVNSCAGGLPSDEIDDDDDGYVDCDFEAGVNAGNWGNTEAEPVVGDGDCDDTLARTNPDADEVCDGLDNDCDESLVDEDGLLSYEPAAGGDWVDYTDDVTGSGRQSLDTADALAAGTFWFCKGTYYTEVLVDTPNAITVEGRYGKDETTLSGRNPANDSITERVINHSDSGTLTLRGLTIEGGSEGGSGGLIRLQNAPTVTIENCDVLDSHTGDKGGGIHLNDGTLTITNTTVSGNDAGNSGAGLYIKAGTVTIDGASTFSGNDTADDAAGEGGGAIYLEAGSLTIEASTITDNTAVGHGGGIYVKAGTLDIENGSTLSLNETSGGTGYGGGIYQLAGATTIDASTLSENVATQSGGGVFVTAGTLDIDNFSTLQENEALGAGGEGGGGVAIQAGTLTITDSTLTLNDATTNDGGAVLTWDDAGADVIAIILDRATISANTASDWGGGIACHETCVIVATDSFITGNTSDEGAGIMLTDTVSTFTCIATSANAAGVYDNEATNTDTDPVVDPGGGLQISVSPGAADVIIDSTQCKWGTSTEDNTPYDFTSPNTSVNNLGDNATFECTTLGCL